MYVHFSSAFNFVNGDPIRKIQKLLLLVPFQNHHSVKNVANILQTCLNQILIKKKTIIDLSTFFRRKFFEEDARNSLLPAQ